MMGGKRSNTFDILAQHERKSGVSRQSAAAREETCPPWFTGDDDGTYKLKFFLFIEIQKCVSKADQLNIMGPIVTVQWELPHKALFNVCWDNEAAFKHSLFVIIQYILCKKQLSKVEYM